MSGHNQKIVDWDVKNQNNQTNLVKMLPNQTLNLINQ